MDVMGIAADFIQDGMNKSGIRLTHNLEAYLAITFARHIDKKIEVDRLTIRVTNALDINAPRDILRTLADECLISCSLFESRLRRNGVVRHYVGLGQMTYDAAGLVEQAHGFVMLRDILSSGNEITDIRHLLDLARGGSVLAKKQLGNVAMFPKKQAWLSY